MTHEEFQKYYEHNSGKLYDELSKLTEAELLNLIANKNEDKYQIWQGKDNYQVWRVLQRKGTKISINPLFKIVSNLENDYLVRYHACDALFIIAKINDNDFKAEVQYGRGKNRKTTDQQKAIAKLENILNPYLEPGNNENHNTKSWWKIW